MNFGQVVVGKQGTQVVSVSNTGNVGVNLTKAVLSDNHFSLTGMATPMALAVGQSGSFVIAVSPTAPGGLTGTLTVQGDGGSTPVAVNLSATGASSQAQLSASPAAVNFGNISTGLKGDQQPGADEFRSRGPDDFSGHAHRSRIRHQRSYNSENAGFGAVTSGYRNIFSDRRRQWDGKPKHHEQ